MSEEKVTIVHWPEIEKVVKGFLIVAREKMERAESNDEMWRYQGAVRAFKQVLNLPDSIPYLRS